MPVVPTTDCLNGGVQITKLPQVCQPSLSQRKGSPHIGSSSRTPLLRPGPLRTGRDSFPSSGSSASNASLEETQLGYRKSEAMNPVMALGMKQETVLGAG